MRSNIHFSLAILAGFFFLAGCKKEAQAEAKTASPVSKIQTAKKQVAKIGAPLLWKIEGGKQTAYVFGTIHLPDDRVTKLRPQVEKAFAASKEVQTEIPMDLATQMGMVQKLFLPDNKTLKDVVPAELFSRVETLFKAKGLPMAGLDRFKIWAVAAQLVLLDKIMEFASKKPLDTQLYERAGKEGKTQGAIETVDEQLAVFDSLTMDEQIRMLKQTLDQMDEKKKEGSDPLEELVLAYLSGDLKVIEAAMNDSYDPESDLDKKIMKRLILDRNKTMAERIAKRVRKKDAKPIFFAVGAGHLVGNEGVVTLLEKAGLKLTRMK